MSAVTSAKRSIAILGDSIPKGVVFHPEKRKYFFYRNGFIKSLTQKLRANIFDFSRFGSTTTYGEQLLRTKLSDLNPDIVLIEYGGNDCDYNWDEVAAHPDRIHLPNLTPDAFEQNLHHMVNAIRNTGKTPVLVNLPPLNSTSYFNWFGKGDAIRKKRILKWLKKEDHIYWWHEKYSYIVDKVAHLTNSHLINIRHAFLEQREYRDFICEDGIHPNEYGQQLIEKAFLHYIEKHAAYIL